MPLSEFDIISTYFNKPGLTPNERQKALIPVGIGDDCAIFSLPPDQQLAISMDVLVADIHFPIDAEPDLIAQRALAVNLSDLAAMGAKPLAFTLGLVLPEVNEQWLEKFSFGLTQSAKQYECPLVGGDISKGPLSISIQVHGLLQANTKMRRSGAVVGDKLYVTGELGAAGLALKLFNGDLKTLSPYQKEALMKAFYQPEPRIDVGLAIASFANAAIDVSDGLVADIGHIARKSKIGIELDITKAPIATTVRELLENEPARHYALCAGDDYELAFTVAPESSSELEQLVKQLGVELTCIGKVVSGAGVTCVDEDGQRVNPTGSGYQHF